ncbi:MAG: L,D-transpeptidase [Deltaproteobacteria bacterium]|nr:MAG: L,D-transpeptidase [Deltaproteobacteria bacterium]
MGAVLGVAVGAGALGAVAWASGCGNQDPPPGPSAAVTSGSTDPFSSLPPPPAMPDDSNAPVVAEPDLPDAGAPETPYEGPWLGALAQATPIYPTARFSRNRLGYIRRGGKVPVNDKPIRTASCKQGFYPLVDGGYVCGKYATLKIDDPRVKMGVKAPDLEALLPYKYAYNLEHGTPLYLSVPSRDEMLAYEPYLADKKRKKKTKKQRREDAEKEAEQADRPRPTASTDGTATATASASASAGARSDGGSRPAPSVGDSDGGLADAGPPPDKPWWQKDRDGGLNVTLAELEEGDGTLSRRMVKGFFIAVDRTFGWNNRLWYKTTEGLIAPTDRMIIPKTPQLEGLVVTSEFSQVGFIRAAKARKYDLGDEGKAPKRTGKVARFTAVGLTGETRLHEKRRYRKTVDGWWMRDRDGTWTDTGPRPSEVADDEKWVDVNLSRKTLMAFVGDRPVYGALISPGKRSKVKKRDHRTKTGKWRVREKHITTTMDGDGPSGDLPYSIQDVPYVQYYDGSYALHGAFWHHNFGREQSHGCINLSPADAKYLFQWTDPPLPRGWHGVWASTKRKGTLVVVHE